MKTHSECASPHNQCGDGVSSVTDVASEMRSSIIELAGERGWSDTRESWLSRAARRAGISYRTARSLFYGQTADPRYSVVERVRRAVAEMNQQQEAKARHEREQFARRIEFLEPRRSSAGAHDDGARADRDW